MIAKHSDLDRQHSTDAFVSLSRFNKVKYLLETSICVSLGARSRFVTSSEMSKRCDPELEQTIKLSILVHLQAILAKAACNQNLIFMTVYGASLLFWLKGNSTFRPRDQRLHARFCLSLFRSNQDKRKFVGDYIQHLFGSPLSDGFKII